MITIEEMERKLKEQGYKMTPQRKAMMEVFAAHHHQLLSAEEIYIMSKAIYPNTNFSTIYRNLEIFENVGLIHKTNIHQQTYSYELAHHDIHHHHIICKSCGKTKCIDFCPLEEVKNKCNLDAFTLTDHKFEIYGYCKDCQDLETKDTCR